MTREHTESFDCTTCGGALFETREAFREHMRGVHHLEKMTGTKKMTLHFDTATHFISIWECEVQGVKFFMTTKTERESAFRQRQRNEHR